MTDEVTQDTTGGVVADAAPALSAAVLGARIAQIEAGNNEAQRAVLLDHLTEAGLDCEPALPVGFTLTLDGLTVTGGPTMPLALESWCQIARIAILRGEAV